MAAPARVGLDAFGLDPTVLHWNHGSFGACPRAALAAQAEVRARLEAATMRYFRLDYEPALAAARGAVAAFLGADPAGLVFVPNATTGVATAVADVALAPGDEVVTTTHAYRACRNQLDRAAAAARATVVIAPVPVPVRDPDAAITAILARVGPRTRLVLVDHVTSPTALVTDVGRLARALPAHVALIVDGAHAPGQLDLAIDDVGATYYAGNLHKWTCAPKGAGFLWASPARRAHLRPLVTSHGASLPGDRYRLEHDWTGTCDPSAYLAAPVAIATVAELGGGWPAVRRGNQQLAAAVAAELGGQLGADPVIDPAIAAEAQGAMAALAVTLPAGAGALAVERALLERGVEVPIVDHPASTGPLVRVSAHVYNTLAEVAPLVDHLRAIGVTGRRLD
ncbi:MAG: aminotransferase class V-fold PLP-dependent enzyme [Kofleriaceae bacterium]